MLQNPHAICTRAIGLSQTKDEKGETVTKLEPTSSDSITAGTIAGELQDVERLRRGGLIVFPSLLVIFHCLKRTEINANSGVDKIQTGGKWSSVGSVCSGLRAVSAPAWIPWGCDQGSQARWPLLSSEV